MLVDIAGKEVKIGDTIAYPRRKRSSLWMTTAKVVDLVIKDTYNYYGETRRRRINIKAQKDSGRIVMIYRTDNVVKIGEATE